MLYLDAMADSYGTDVIVHNHCIDIYQAVHDITGIREGRIPFPIPHFCDSDSGSVDGC